VHVRYAEGFVVEGLYTPVWITGPLAAERATPTVRYVDGEARVEVSYAMDASLVEPY
jgi:hypothetical protein